MVRICKIKTKILVRRKLMITKMFMRTDTTVVPSVSVLWNSFKFIAFDVVQKAEAI